MGASEIIRHVYKETLDHFGEPDGSIRFCDPPPPPNSGWPERIDVFYWYDTDDLDITTEFNETTIQIINLVPITAHEVKYKKQHNPFLLLDYFHDNNIDLFQDRETNQKNV